MDKSRDFFGEKLFSSKIMKNYVPKPIFTRWENSVKLEEPMDAETADAIAHAMKVWASENGATHYSHWFHPMHGSSAEKHDAFIEPDEDGTPILRFSGKNLLKGETDGSSFPNGGLRQTFEARGYTYWDVTSPAFIRGHVLFIPSVFISYHGEALDEKAPLIRAMDSLSASATRVVQALGDKSVTHVRAMVGLEQEYFMVKKSLYDKRDDLKHCDRALFGNPPSKNQEHVGHYFGAIPSDIVHFMEEVNEELWKLGVYSKVEHNEVSPSQFEIVVVYQDANVAIDQNMLVMETLKRKALKHGYVALLHEKPFSYINGSGKHNNFSLTTSSGANLFDPGDRPHENIRFLLFVSALIKSVDKHAGLLRYASSTPGNDYRLGASEAPPAIISIYIGDILKGIFDELETSKSLTVTKDQQYFSPLSTLHAVPRDYSDRNRTSPFAFSGSKFEFRMPGSSICSAFVNTTLAAILAETLDEMANELEKFKYVSEAREKALELCQEVIKNHKRIIFNGDGYHQDWIEEAEKRGLPHFKQYIDSTISLLDETTVSMFAKTKVLSKRELDARYEISQSLYIETIQTEAKTLVSMITSQLLPAMTCELSSRLKAMSLGATSSTYLKTTSSNLITLLDSLNDTCLLINNTLNTIEEHSDMLSKVTLIRETLKPLIDKAVKDANESESIVSKENYPFPTFSDLLFS